MFICYTHLSKRNRKRFSSYVGKEKIFKFYDEINFVAIKKNGMHSKKGYCSYHGEIENFQIKENDHVKEIFNSINKFFN